MLRHVFEFEEYGCICIRLNYNIERPILENFEYLSINSARKIMLIGFKNKIKIDIFIRSKDLKNNSRQFETDGQIRYFTVGIVRIKVYYGP